MATMNALGLKDRAAWERAGVVLPKFDWETMVKNTEAAHGCLCAAHGLDACMFEEPREAAANVAFTKAMAGARKAALGQ